ncbi:TonB-dependent receptor domain-containing protein [Alteromonas oceanisediminis]|uniref:TonB-dependent receptor domain-containing protein n=1 Tax=Alteromonas oceanisediminis TaxID=2836180 RepID=UPI001BDB44D7|nr:TonB-dependent receptor [Alteromonas oceanisediminis]MBT0585290.1 TonB-dependent receptor [Alteromonas oceanisediminis]
MNKPAQRFPYNRLTTAIVTGLLLQPIAAVAQESTSAQDEDQVIEEVVSTGTRLKGTATAVLQERKNQAFVADILGAEQISRTGDSDAASALRRVTGLTLVDGKFIYVRGLGERYSSTQLNGASVPSPDPTRNVIPLDLFPSDIIESLSVQKAFSPSMPASFGGGNVDIRLKTIPTDYIFNMSGSLGGNTENFDDAYQYGGGDNDWEGQDDGFRAAPASIANRWSSKNFLDNLDQSTAVDLLRDVQRNYDPALDSVNPDVGFNVALGNSFDFNQDIRYGFLATAGYDNSTQVSEQFLGEQQSRDGESVRFIRFFDQVDSTEKSVKWSGMFNFGIDYQRNHRIDYSLIALNDTRDEVREKIGNTANIQLVDNQRIRDVEVIYEERQMYTNQVRGKHTFPELAFLGFDWKYSLGRSNRDAPGNFQSRFILEDFNGDGIFDRDAESSLSNAPTAARYSFQTLHDRVENYGYNFNIPYYMDKWEMEFKAGADFITKSRTAENRRFDVNTRAFADSSILTGSVFSDILSDDVLNNAAFTNQPIIRDTTIAGDDYVAGQKIDAYYFEADLFFDNTWRISGGVRYEDFRQAVVPFDPRTNQIDIIDGADRSQLAFLEDDFYPAIALTYFINPDMQLRTSFSETVVRPDLREVSSATYLDPLTDNPIAGTPGVRTTSVKNYDIRWEWYREAGNNLSVGLFYKDMTDPIESVQSPAQDGPPLIRIANAETGELYGVEVEFLQGLDVIGEGVWDNLFLSGNVTLSDSEITLDPVAIEEQTGVSAAITNTQRRLTGHSEYVVNLQLGFDSDNGEHSASLVYNVFGERIIVPGIDFFDDNFEQPFHSLDVVYKFYPDFNSTLTLKVQNILDESRELEFEGVTFQSETKGIGFSLSYKYEF